MHIKGFQVDSQISVGDPDNSSHGSHYSFLGTGGYVEVFTIAERNAIPVGEIINDEGLSSGRRRLGMRVYIIDTKETFILGAETTETAWNALNEAGKIAFLLDNNNWIAETAIVDNGSALSAVLFVNNNGSATTPEKGNIFKPYQHPNDALAAAVDGDLIIVMGGVYSNVGQLCVQGGEVIWELRGDVIFNFAASALLIDNNLLESQTYIYGGEISTLNHNTATSNVLFSNINTDSIIHIEVGNLNINKSLTYNCKSVIIDSKIQANLDTNALPFVGNLPDEGSFILRGEVENINSTSLAPLIDCTATTVNNSFLFKDLLVKDETAGTNSFFRGDKIRIIKSKCHITSF